MSDVKIEGAFRAAALGVLKFSSIANVTGTGVDVSNSSSGFNASVYIEGIGASYDIKDLGLTLGSTKTLLGGSGAGITVTGSANADVIYDASASGAETLLGGAGNDTLIGGAGNNAIDGGAGVDTAIVYATPTFGHDAGGSLTVTTGAGTDTLANVEYLVQLDPANNNAVVQSYVLIDGQSGATTAQKVDAAIAMASAMASQIPNPILVAGGNLQLTLAQTQALHTGAPSATFSTGTGTGTAETVTDPQNGAHPWQRATTEPFGGSRCRADPAAPSAAS